jgi:hypothetical protein
MCEICDDIDKEDSGCDGGPNCICHKSEASCQPSDTNASGASSVTYPPIFDPLLGAGDASGVPVPLDDSYYQLVVDTHDVMSPGRMDKLMREFFEMLMKKCQRKNKAYAETDATSDALNNFREAEKTFDTKMMLYAEILKDKHRRAWQTYVRTGEAPDKPFRILGDTIVYALLQYCIAIDQKLWDHEQEVMQDDD